MLEITLGKTILDNRYFLGTYKNNSQITLGGVSEYVVNSQNQTKPSSPTRRAEHPNTPWVPFMNDIVTIKHTVLTTFAYFQLNLLLF